MEFRGQTVGLIGALTSVPRRIAARDVEAAGGTLRRGVTRRTAFAVFGRRLLLASSPDAIAGQLVRARDAGAAPMSEAVFVRTLRRGAPLAQANLDARTLREQTGLAETDFELLALFDAFEGHGERFTFRDAILGRKYAGLIAGGADWLSIVRSIHLAGEVTSLTAASLQRDRHGEIVAHFNARPSALDGQMLLPLPEDNGPDLDSLFEAAQECEGEGDFAAAVGLYRRCLAADPRDSVAAFNLANCAKSLGEAGEARAYFALAIRHDPAFVEAWFNLGGLLRELGHAAEARAHLRKAAELDPEYADAVYNLAALDFDRGDHAAARAGWTRYLELDTRSDWAARARRGIRYIDLHRTAAAGRA